MKSQMIVKFNIFDKINNYMNIDMISDVIQETLCQRLLLVKYFELKISDNHSDDFLRMLLKNDLSFS